MGVAIRNFRARLEGGGSLPFGPRQILAPLAELGLSVPRGATQL